MKLIWLSLLNVTSLSFYLDVLVSFTQYCKNSFSPGCLVLLQIDSVCQYIFWYFLYIFVPERWPEVGISIIQITVRGRYIFQLEVITLLLHMLGNYIAGDETTCLLEKKDTISYIFLCMTVRYGRNQGSVDRYVIPVLQRKKDVFQLS